MKVTLKKHIQLKIKVYLNKQLNNIINIKNILFKNYNKGQMEETQEIHLEKIEEAWLKI